MLKIHQLKKSTPPPVVTGLTNELWWQVCQRSLQASACILWPLPVFLAFFKSSFGVLKRFCSVHHGRQIGDPDSLWTGFRVVIGINNFMEICERGINQQLFRKLLGQSQLTANELDLDLNTKINILGTLRPWQFSCQTLLTRKPGWSSAHPGISSWSGGFVEKPRAIMKCHLAELGSSSHGRIRTLIPPRCHLWAQGSITTNSEISKSPLCLHNLGLHLNCVYFWSKYDHTNRTK